MSDTHEMSVGGDSAKFMSDGLTLLLENGRTVRPRLKSADDGEVWRATWVDPDAREVGLGPDIDDTRVVLSLSPGTAVFTEDGERVWHYEWLGHLYCDRTDSVLDWQTGEVTCPHCDDTFTVPESEPPAEA